MYTVIAAVSRFIYVAEESEKSKTKEVSSESRVERGASRPASDQAQSDGQSMIDRLLRVVPEEARLPDNDTLDPLEGTWKESAYLDEDGTLILRYWSQKDYVIADGWDQVKPDEDHYAEFCEKYGLKRNGDTSQIFKRLIDGEWVVVDDKQNPAI